MKQAYRNHAIWWMALAVLALAVATGCKHQPTRTDQQIAADVQTKIKGEQALASQNIQVSVQDGVATLSGSVSDEASRSLAGNDSGSIDGVKTVVNNLTVQPGQQAETPQAMPQPSMPAAPQQKPSASRDRDRHTDNPAAQQSQPAPPPAQSAQSSVPAAPAPPPAPPKPTTKTVTLPAGTIVPVRLTETLDSGKTQPNDAFHGALASDIGIQGVIAVPRGTPVMGRVVDVKEAAHFKGNALLSIELTDITPHGQRVSVDTDPFNKEGAGRGKNTAAKTGGGAALGAIIGGIAGGGKGALIGGLAGAGAGAGVNAVTHGQQAVIPTETVVNFQLKSPITLTVPLYPTAQDSGDIPDPQLQNR